MYIGILSLFSGIFVLIICTPYCSLVWLVDFVVFTHRIPNNWDLLAQIHFRNICEAYLLRCRWRIKFTPGQKAGFKLSASHFSSPFDTYLNTGLTHPIWNLLDTSSRSSYHPCDGRITGCLFLGCLQTPALGSQLGWVSLQNDRPAFGSFHLLPRGWLWEKDSIVKRSGFPSEICWPQKLHHVIFQKLSRFRLNFSVILVDD